MRVDHRNRDPRGTHKRAFLGGWTDAVNGIRYASIDTRKTHANMGNLFGWIFGNKQDEVREEIWELYLKHAFDEAVED